MANGDPVRVGQPNFGSAETVVQATVNTPASTLKVQVGAGSSGAAVSGLAGPGIGVKGENLTGLRPGIWGRSSGGIFGAVMGDAPSIGVRGHGSTGVVGQGGVGVNGFSVGAAGIGVVGDVIDQLGQDNGSAGVIGRAEAGPGVSASSATGTGALAASTSGPGVDARSDTAPGVVARSRDSTGVQASGGSIGVSGKAPQCGVMGEAQSGWAIYGTTQGSGDGVRGESTGGWGVVGFGREHPGVGARSQSGAGLDAASASGPGVVAAGRTFGVSAAASQGVGVRGESTAGAAGVLGVGPRSFGVWGQSDLGVGAVGSSTSGVGVAALGRGSLPALVAYGLGGGGAARFVGDVMISGSLTVTAIKAAAVRHPDGTLRRLHCVEAPEAMFEDMGEAELVDGRAEVKLDPDFAALVDLDGYQVMLTSYAPVALYVSRRDAEAFEIAVVEGPRPARGREPVRCGWRVVARRRDVERERLAVVPESEPPDLMADVDMGKPPRPGEPATTRLDPPTSPPERPLPLPPEAPRADLADLEGAGG